MRTGGYLSLSPNGNNINMAFNFSLSLSLSLSSYHVASPNVKDMNLAFKALNGSTIPFTAVLCLVMRGVGEEGEGERMGRGTDRDR